MPQTKILSLLSPHGLHQLYEGEEAGIVLVLVKRAISETFVRLHVRDALYQDGCFCDTKSNLEGVETGEVRWFYKSICVNIP